MAPTCLVQSQLSWELPADPPPAQWGDSEALKHTSLIFFPLPKARGVLYLV